MQYTTKYFSIEYNDSDISIDVFYEFIRLYQNAITDIFKQFNTKDIRIHLLLFNKEQLDDFVKLNSISYKNTTVPSWLVGFSSSETVCVLNPTDENLNNIVKVAIHESIHYILYNTFPNSIRCKLLDEGLATYYSKQNTKYGLMRIKEDFEQQQLKNISELNIQNSIEFANINGYSYSYYVIEFLLQEFNIEQILKWYIDISLFEADVKNMDLNSKFIEYMQKKIC